MSPWLAEAPEPHAQDGTWLEPDGPAAAAAAAASAACRAALSDDAFDWAEASSPASLFRFPLVSLTNVCCRDTAAWMATLRSFAACRAARLATSSLCACARNTVATALLAWFAASVSVPD